MTVSSHLLLIGASARAAAFSALRVGLHPRCMDLFADVDLQRRCTVTRLTERYPDGFRPFIESDLPGPWMYTGGLENWPRFVERLAGHRFLWGNGESALSLARDPEYVTRLLQSRAMPAPAVYRPGEEPAGSRRCLVKPRKSAGGTGIRFRKETDAGASSSSTYRQEFIEGHPVALLFLGADGEARFLGMTQQLVGVSWLHAAPFRYCGSIGPLDPGIIQRPVLKELGDLLVRDCSLRGLFGVDGILRDGVFWPVEINPRYTASVEVVEYATGLPALAWHGSAFTGGQSPAVPSAAALHDRSIGKAILFARDDLLFPADGPWLTELRSPTPIHELPAFADIPAAGERIKAGRPIVTFFATAGSVPDCAEQLRRIAADLDRWLFER